ncbi:MAG: hypothetical protein ABSA46_12890 [Thermodesulfovibrionales bacterium]|jgi:hypothetical protein
MRKLLTVWLLIISMFVLAAASAYAASTPTISSASINYSTNQITIKGSAFPTSKPSVVFNGTTLTVVGTPTATSITATLPSGVAQGTYTLTVSTSAAFDVTYGAVGPQGPQGATGATGPAGPQGIQGPAGPQGPIGLTGQQGPQGLQGPIGATGATGSVGPIGPPGVANGITQAVHGTFQIPAASGGPDLVYPQYTVSNPLDSYFALTFQTPFNAIPDCVVTNSANVPSISSAIDCWSTTNCEIEFNQDAITQCGLSANGNPIYCLEPNYASASQAPMGGQLITFICVE